MLIIEVQALNNGAHRNQTCNLSNIPEGWAEVPPSIEIPDTFPFVNIEVEDGVVTSMTAGVVPDPEPEPEPEPTIDERVAALETEKANQTDVDELNEALNMILTGYTGEERTDEAGTEG